MTTAAEIKLLKQLKKILQKDIYPKHSIKEMDMECPECRAAIHVAFINQRLDHLEFFKKSVNIKNK